MIRKLPLVALTTAAFLMAFLAAAPADAHTSIGNLSPVAYENLYATAEDAA